jgi:3-deoxy-manno-octulosonate cytidylyltransferase (CMP-KDO synthetase)
MRTVGVIPARMASSRFPGKPLAEIAGRPMLAWCHDGSARSDLLDEVVIATCDREIMDWAEGAGIHAVMTADTHERATDRVAEAVHSLDAEAVVLIQGDEPLVSATMVDAALRPVVDGEAACTNLAKRITEEAEFDSPNTVKLVVDLEWNALCFTRSRIPTTLHLGWDAIRAYKQVAIFGFTRERLLEFAQLEPTPLEKAESVDMLRYIEHGRAIRIVPNEETTHAVDVPEDIEVIERLLTGR